MDITDFEKMRTVGIQAEAENAVSALMKVLRAVYCGRDEEARMQAQRALNHVIDLQDQLRR